MDKISDLPEVEDEKDDNVVFVPPKQNTAENINESYGSTPLEDRYGRHLWIRTRVCFCDVNSPTDCRFHDTSEKGWAECPNLHIAKKDKNMRGIWLWAHNPLYGKPLTEEELEERIKLLAEAV